jgi:uncharacterized protein YecT (DUF1311 family)
MRLRPVLSCLIVLIASVDVPAQGNTAELTPVEIKQVINEYSDCDSLDKIAIDHLEFFDFRGDGHKEAVVVASTCMTGTAGPDVHAVYERGSDAKIVEHSLDQLDPVKPGSGFKLPVFGNPNYGIAIEDGHLVARWMDSSERETPLIIWYKWNGTEFEMDHMKVEGPFKTSYDCGKATSEMDRAICYSPKIAAVDVQLANLYVAALQRSPGRKQVLQQEQREWLTQRDKQCTIYKWWVDCLNEMYTKRISELKASAGALKAE